MPLGRTLFDLQGRPGAWSAGSGATWSLRSRRVRPAGDLGGLPRQARVVAQALKRSSAQALKRYGLIVADNGSDWFVSGAPHPRWDNDQLHALGRLTGREIEVVDTSTLQP